MNGDELMSFFYTDTILRLQRVISVGEKREDTALA